VIALSPGLGGFEIVVRWRGLRCGKRQGSPLPAGWRHGHARRILYRPRRQPVNHHRFRSQQALPQLNQSIHRLVPLSIRHVDQVSEIRNGIVESGTAQFLQQAALQFDRDLLQCDDGDGVAALEGYAEALDAALFLALDVGWGLVDGLFQQARGRCCALLGALYFDLLDDGAAVAVG